LLLFRGVINVCTFQNVAIIKRKHPAQRTYCIDEFIGLPSMGTSEKQHSIEKNTICMEHVHFIT
jgi:hypothetical protein